MVRLLSCIAVVTLVSCAPSQKKYSADAMEREASLWNHVADDPPTYIPKGYPEGAPRTKEKGLWVESKVNGNRFFIPGEGAGGMSAHNLRCSALRAIDQIGPKKSFGESVDDIGGAVVGGVVGVAVPVVIEAEKAMARERWRRWRNE